MKFLQLIILCILCSGCYSKKTIKQPILEPKTDVSTIKKDTLKLVKTKLPNPETVENVIETKTIEVTSIDTISIKKNKDTIQQVAKKPILSLHKSWHDLLQKNVSNKGNVNYKAFKADHKKLNNYINLLHLEKLNTNFQTLSKEEQLAYWINAYNALTIDLILKNYPVKSIKDIKDPWGQRLWKLGDTWYNLEDIEHKILRKMNEPRIHFSIVCASFSCPKLQNEAFTSENLESQLTNATKGFLADSNRNNISATDIKISKIFQWFAADFKQNGSLIDFLNQYSEVKISNKAKITYKDYNWSLNE